MGKDINRLSSLLSVRLAVGDYISYNEQFRIKNSSSEELLASAHNYLIYNIDNKLRLLSALFNHALFTIENKVEGEKDRYKNTYFPTWLLKGTITVEEYTYKFSNFGIKIDEEERDINYMLYVGPNEYVFSYLLKMSKNILIINGTTDKHTDILEYNKDTHKIVCSNNHSKYITMNDVNTIKNIMYNLDNKLGVLIDNFKDVISKLIEKAVDNSIHRK